VHGPDGFTHRHVVVAHFECRAKLVLSLQIRLGVGDGDRDRRRIRTPRELLDGILRVRELQGIAAGQRHGVELQHLVRVRREERDGITGGRPAGRSGMMALPGEGAHLMAGDVDQDDFRLVLIRIDVGSSFDQGDRLAIGGKTRVGEADNAQEVVNIHRRGCGDHGREHEQRKNYPGGGAHGHEVPPGKVRQPGL